MEEWLDEMLEMGVWVNSWWKRGQGMEDREEGREKGESGKV